MKKQHWSTDQLRFLKENVGKLTLEEIAEYLGKSPLAVKLKIHRENIVYRQAVQKNLILELFKLKFGDPKFFTVTKDFIRATGINQVRFWKLYRGEENPTEKEYKALVLTLKVDLQDAFEARQINIF